MAAKRTGERAKPAVLVATGKRPDRRRVPGGWRAAGYALLVHAVLAVLLVVSVQWSSREPAAPIPAYIAPEPVPGPEKPAPTQPEPARAAPQKKPEERKPVEAEARQRAQEEEKKREAERKAEQQRLEARRAAEKQEKQRAEARREEEAAKRRRQAKAALKESLAAEEHSREERERERKETAQVEQYSNQIAAHVTRYSQRTPGLPAGLKCTVRIRLTAGGTVLHVTVVRSSGNAAFDRDAENSVRRSEPLPVPQDLALFERMREIEFVFNPQQ